MRLSAIDRAHLLAGALVCLVSEGGLGVPQSGQGQNIVGAPCNGGESTDGLAQYCLHARLREEARELLWLSAQNADDIMLKYMYRPLCDCIDSSLIPMVMQLC